jgi:DNA-binding MarR family transcriptional regulator
MTRLIDGMEKHDLVVRVPDKQDKRQKLIYLTNKGKTLQKKLILIVHQTLEQAEKGISSKDIELCMNVLNKIYVNVQQKTNVACATNKKDKRVS